MSTLIITVGLPGCGKSTWAEAFKAAQKRPDDVSRVAVIERDRIRAREGIVPGDFSRETWVTRLQNDYVDGALTDYRRAASHRATGHDFVVVSDTNLQPRYRRRLVEIAARRNADVQYKVFGDGTLSDLQLALERNGQRAGTSAFVPPEVIASFYERFVVTGAWLQGIDKTARI